MFTAGLLFSNISILNIVLRREKGKFNLHWVTSRISYDEMQTGDKNLDSESWINHKEREEEEKEGENIGRFTNEP